MWLKAEQGVNSHINLKCAVPVSVQDVGIDGQGMGGSSSSLFVNLGIIIYNILIYAVMLLYNYFKYCFNYVNSIII